MYFNNELMLINGLLEAGFTYSARALTNDLARVNGLTPFQVAAVLTKAVTRL